MIIPELGFFCLILALLYKIHFLYINRRDKHCLNNLIVTVNLNAALMFGAVCSLVYSLMICDFSVWYVSTHASTGLPLLYRFCALWGGHEGSLLLWCFFQALWLLCLVRVESKENARLTIQACSILILVAVGFELYLLLLSNPFLRNLPLPPLEGRDLNPLLQDPGLVSHPPILYAGYVGTSIPFAYALAMCSSNDCRTLPWANRARFWAGYAWLFLTVGIILGSWWAYRELGWGGWWFWDPVENASLMPWLCTTALLHSLLASERKMQLVQGSIILALLTFCFSILGTFIVRSGIVVSVHAFASDPGRGVFLLAFLGIVLLSCILIYTKFHKQVITPNAPLSTKINLLWINSACLIAATLTVLLGTLYPLILEVLNLGRISVGPPYYNQTVVPMMLFLLVLMVFQLSVNWSAYKTSEVMQSTYRQLAAILALACFAYFGLGMNSLAIIIGFSVSLWLLVLHIYQLILFKIYSQRQYSLAMLLGHLGFAGIVFSICMSEHLVNQSDYYLKVNDRVLANGYQIELLGTKQIESSNFTADQAEILFTKNDESFLLLPEKRYYPVADMTLAKSAINVHWIQDVYVTLGNLDNDGNWTARIAFRPWVRWMWYGGLVMAVSILTTSRLTRRRRD